jgi:methionyl aminopeptidase
MRAAILATRIPQPLMMKELASRTFGNSSSGVGIAFEGKDASSSSNEGPSSLFFSSSRPEMDSFSALRHPVKPFPLSPTKPVPADIPRPPYADTGVVPPSNYVSQILLHDETTIPRMKHAARLARRVLNYACSLAKPGVNTDDIDTAVHEAIIDAGAYPSPLNYVGFPKSLCSSINEVICHGIPDSRTLERGDIVSFDVSCFVGGVHGDNCATIIVGDEQEVDEIGVDWRGVPYKAIWDSPEEEAMMRSSRRLVYAARESLYAAIDAIGPGGCLTQAGAAIEDVADEYGYSTVGKYQGHGIGEVFHCAPFVQVSYPIYNIGESAYLGGRSSDLGHSRAFLSPVAFPKQGLPRTGSRNDFHH